MRDALFSGTSRIENVIAPLRLGDSSCLHDAVRYTGHLALMIGELLNHTPTAPSGPMEAGDFPAMLATLCFYEDQLGPYHPHTLRLLVDVGIAYVEKGYLEGARCLLTRASRDVARTLGPGHELRSRAVAGLRDLFMRSSEWERAADAQRELVECHTLRFGPDHLQTFAARADLANLAMKAPLAQTNNRQM